MMIEITLFETVVLLELSLKLIEKKSHTNKRMTVSEFIHFELKSQFVFNETGINSFLLVCNKTLLLTYHWLLVLKLFKIHVDILFLKCRQTQTSFVLS